MPELKTAERRRYGSWERIKNSLCILCAFIPSETGITDGIVNDKFMSDNLFYIIILFANFMMIRKYY